ncbi:MAG TPA: LacI family DNA-binding transcriptional regulator [Candidatus Didemnitutus sp.]|nr:LacI family DNA-binding transcriptional regulator [Candidatus Didemnitutus sp.]
MNSRTTMAMVAARAGVHTTTVSLALRNHPSLPVETRDRLRALAAEMGYHRDPALTALVAYRRGSRPSKSNPLIAYMTNWESRWGWKEHPAHLAFFEGAQHKGAELGYRLEHFWLREAGMTHRRLSRILYARGITGIILASHEKEADGPIDFEWSHFSAVKIDSSPCSMPLHTVTNDQRTIVALAMRRVLAAGYRRVGFVMPFWWDAFVARAWSGGFLAEQQLLATSDRIPILYYSTPSSTRQQAAISDHAVSQEQLSAWLREHRPEVIVSCGPFVKAPLGELGIAIPKDVAFVDIFLEKPDGLTAGVHQNCHRVGELAVEAVAGQLQEHLAGIPTIPTATLVEGTWHDGASLPMRQGPNTAPFVSQATGLGSPVRLARRKVAV